MWVSIGKKFGEKFGEKFGKNLGKKPEEYRSILQDNKIILKVATTAILCLFTLFIAIKLTYFIGFYAKVILLASLFVLSIFIIIFFKLPLYSRYILGTISLVSYYLVFFIYPVSIGDYFMHVFFLLMLYAYIFPDRLSPILVGCLISVRFYIFLKADNVSFRIVRDNMVNVIVLSFCYSMIFHLMRKLTSERNNFKKLSMQDLLTGVYNLKFIIDKGNQLLKLGHRVSAIIIDMNHFKHINDTYGHMIGNNVLKQIAAYLDQKAAEVDGIAGRLGGDEFVIMLHDCTPQFVTGFIEGLHSDINCQRFNLDPDIDPFRLSFSIGKANSVDGSVLLTMENLLYNADIDMYYNKYGKGLTNRHAINKHHEFPFQIKQFLNVLAEKDMYTYVHSEFTAQYAASLARKLELTQHQITEIYIAGWLHDIGKILISNNILRKTGSLEDAEFMVIKKHLNYGIQVLGDQHLPEIIENGVKYHHEQWDGNGYPWGLKGEDIPLEARILKIADSFSAMIIKRVYRKPLKKHKALLELRKHAGTHFDPELVSLFESIFIKEERNYINETINKWLYSSRVPETSSLVSV